jgi:hypothetical protein
MGQTQTASSKAESYTRGAEIDHLASPPHRPLGQVPRAGLRKAPPHLLQIRAPCTVRSRFRSPDRDP